MDQQHRRQEDELPDGPEQSRRPSTPHEEPRPAEVSDQAAEDQSKPGDADDQAGAELPQDELTLDGSTIQRAADSDSPAIDVESSTADFGPQADVAATDFQPYTLGDEAAASVDDARYLSSGGEPNWPTEPGSNDDAPQPGDVEFESHGEEQAAETDSVIDEPSGAAESGDDEVTASSDAPRPAPERPGEQPVPPVPMPSIRGPSTGDEKYMPPVEPRPSGSDDYGDLVLRPWHRTPFGLPDGRPPLPPELRPPRQWPPEIADLLPNDGVQSAPPSMPRARESVTVEVQPTAWESLVQEMLARLEQRIERQITERIDEQLNRYHQSLVVQLRSLMR